MFTYKKVTLWLLGFSVFIIGYFREWLVFSTVEQNSALGFSGCWCLYSGCVANDGLPLQRRKHSSRPCHHKKWDWHFTHFYLPWMNLNNYILLQLKIQVMFKKNYPEILCDSVLNKRVHIHYTPYTCHFHTGINSSSISASTWICDSWGSSTICTFHKHIQCLITLKGSYDAFLNIIIWCNRIWCHALMFTNTLFFKYCTLL